MTNLDDTFTRHGHFVERYKTGQFNRFIPFLNRVISGLRSELLKTSTVRSQDRIRKKIKGIEALILSEFGDFTDSFNEQLGLFAESEVGFAARAIDQDDLIIPTLQKLRTAVNARPFNNLILREALKDFTINQAKFIRNAISTGFFTGSTTPEIVRNIVGTRRANYRDGLLNVTRVSANRLVRTAITHTAAVAKDKLYEDNSDIISHYEWLSRLDSRTSEICTELDGNIYRVGKGRLPPAHYNCRSTTIPVFIGEEKTKQSL